MPTEEDDLENIKLSIKNQMRIIDKQNERLSKLEAVVNGDLIDRIETLERLINTHFDNHLKKEVR